MIVECSHCKARYSIPDEKVPRRRAMALCKKCHKQIIIEPDSVVEAAEEQAPEIEEPSELAIDRFNALLEADFPQVSSLPQHQYAFWKIFTPNAEGGYKNLINTHRLKVLSVSAPLLADLLAPNEKVQGAAGVISRSPVDWLLFNPLLSGIYNHYALIATDRRLLLINIDPRIKKRLHTIFQFPIASIRKLGRGFFKRRFVLQTASGRRWAFKPMKHAALEPLISQIQELLPQTEASEPSDPVAEAICPACLTPFKDATERCPHCGTVFKSPFGAAVKSLVLPGWGNIYLKRTWIGIFEILISVLIWLVVLDAIVAHQRYQLTMALYLVLVYNGTAGIVTFFSARREYRVAKKAQRNPSNAGHKAAA